MLAILESAMGVSLVDQSTWKSRPEDIEWQENILKKLQEKNLEEPGYYSHDLIKSYEDNIGCFRFRPEEVGAAGATDGFPADFQYCEEYGQRIKVAVEFGIDTYRSLFL